MATGKWQESWIQSAIDAQQKYGIPASITLAQIAEESGWGTSSIAQKAKNMFGQKATSSEASISTSTGNYKIYSSFEQSILDHGKKWGTDRVGTHNSVEDYISAMIKEGYIPDESYKDRLLSIIRQYNLSQYDTDVTTSAGITTGAISDDANKVDGALKNIIRFLMIVMVAVIGIVFFATAFNTDLPQISKLKNKKKAVAK